MMSNIASREAEVMNILDDCAKIVKMIGTERENPTASVFMGG